jgi:hypothetical protein
VSRSVVGASVEGPWTLGGITVTCIEEASPELVSEFWPLYEEAFGPLRIRAAARNVLSYAEFAEEIADPRVWKYVATDADGNLIGLTTLTRDLATVPWISPEYFAHHYPEQTSRHAVFYMGFTLVKPSRRDTRVFFAMLRPTALRVASERGVCAYDVCGFNDTTFDFGAGIERLLHRLAEVDVAAVDVQTYYAVRFTGVLKGAKTVE